MKKKDLADSLVEEGLTEAAESFFGRRVNLEHEIELLKQKAGELRKKNRRIERWRKTVYYLLNRCDQSLVQEFHRELDLDFKDSISSCDKEELYLRLLKIPVALRMKTRFSKVFFQAYAGLEDAVDEYLNGKYYVDPKNEARKVRSIHYGQIRERVKLINAQIEKMNTFSRTSEILQFSKKMDVDTLEKEKIVDAPMEYTIDRDMDFEKVDFESLNLPDYEELPRPEQVRDRLKRFSLRICREHPGDVSSIMKEIKEAKRDAGSTP